MSLIIHAPNVHQGGGRALLVPLLKALRPGTARVVLLDARLPLDGELPPDVQVIRISRTFAGRFMAEWRLRRLARSDDTVLCFGNLPPLFALPAHVVVYIQNRYHVFRAESGRLPAAVRLRLWVEHRWFDIGRRSVGTFVVQTPSMQREAERQLGIRARIMPFVADPRGYTRRMPPGAGPESRKYDFVYVASGEPHKNHARLIEAWRILAADGIRPTLCLTLNRASSPVLCRWIESEKKLHGLRIELAEAKGEADLTGLYKEAGALIYPSTFESFGLPLIEARQSGLPIVAAELEYVRDVVDPEESFDPQSAVSIARAVTRFMGVRQDELDIVDAASFLRRLIKQV